MRLRSQGGRPPDSAGRKTFITYLRHLPRALGYAQCQQGRPVLFTTLAGLVNRLTAAEATKTLHQVLRQYQAPGVLLVDEVGYVALRQPESHLFFQVISARHDRRRPTVFTTNRIFGEWNQIFHDDAVAHAILDRLAERAEVFHLEGTSSRETHRRPASRAPQPEAPGPLPARARGPSVPSAPALAPPVHPSVSRRKSTPSATTLATGFPMETGHFETGASTREGCSKLIHLKRTCNRSLPLFDGIRWGQ